MLGSLWLAACVPDDLPAARPREAPSAVLAAALARGSGAAPSAARLRAGSDWSAVGDWDHTVGAPGTFAAVDLNGDGYDELLVGWRPGDWQDYSGRSGVDVHAGSPAGPSPSPIARLDLSRSEMMEAVTAAGDVNGDGVDDLVVDAGGRMQVHLGARAGADLVADQVLGTGVYRQVIALGDVNGDGFDDVMAQCSFWLDVHLGSAAGLLAPA